MSIITVGIDLAKNVFAVHGVDEYGKAALTKPKVSRRENRDRPRFFWITPQVAGR